jgi:hypothetical protein
MHRLTPVVVESPYAGDVEGNLAYLDRAILDCLQRGEAPFASHRLYTFALRDSIPEERVLGIEAGLRWGELASRTVVYLDRGVSSGMLLGIQHAVEHGRPVEVRCLDHVPAVAIETLAKFAQEHVGSPLVYPVAAIVDDARALRDQADEAQRALLTL